MVGVAVGVVVGVAVGVGVGVGVGVAVGVAVGVVVAVAVGVAVVVAVAVAVGVAVVNTDSPSGLTDKMRCVRSHSSWWLCRANKPSSTLCDHVWIIPVAAVTEAIDAIEDAVNKDADDYALDELTGFYAALVRFRALFTVEEQEQST